MGVDLRLLFDSGDGRIEDSIEMERDSALFEEIILLEEKEGFSISRDGIRFNERTIRSTPYGKRLKSISALELFTLLNGLNLQPMNKNLAIKEYLRFIRPNIIIWLYWN